MATSHKDLKALGICVWKWSKREEYPKLTFFLVLKESNQQL